MVLRYPRYLVLITCCLFIFSSCSDFKAIFVGNSYKKVSKEEKKTKKRRDKPAKKNIKRGQFIWPVDGEISSGYGLRDGRKHDGIDIRAKEDTPFVAADAGEVVFSGKLGGYGQLIVIKHANNFFTTYAHNKKNLAAKGNKVKQGKVIGRVGRTGKATGYHLHFEVRDEKAVSYDPLDFLPARR